MVSYSMYYAWIHKDFDYSKWFLDNCDKCYYGNLRAKEFGDNGYCFMESELHILSGKPRQMQYIAMQYHKLDNKNYNCPFLTRRGNDSKEAKEKDN